MQIEAVKQFKQMSQDCSILMVDDEVDLTDNYLEIAKRFFKHVQIANSAKEALEYFQKDKYDLIYTDLNMPGMSGIELIHTIKTLDPKQKFIVISASDDSDKLMKLLAMSISGFIVKPFNLDNFIHVSMEQVSILLQSRLIQEQTDQLHQDLKKVTQEKQIQEDMLIQQSKLAQTGEMISMIAHQWRQPLSSITTVLSTLKTRLELGLYDELEDPVSTFTSDFTAAYETLEEAAVFLTTTIDDFRNFYRPDNEAKSFKACDAMKSVLGMLNLGLSKIEVKLDCTHCINSSVYTFESELKQVFMSIINNAADALQEKSIEEAKIYISLKDEGENLLISIIDNAGGIANNIIDKIFLPYFSTKNEKNGTGLGLHMAKTIIENHVHGSLSVQNSTRFGGAEFKINIPKSEQG